MSLLAPLAALAFAGCVSKAPPRMELDPPTVVGTHALHPSLELQYMSCDYRRWFVRGQAACDAGEDLGEDRHCRASSLHAHSQDSKRIAVESFVYAMMANNVYRDIESKPPFATPGWTVRKRVTAESGLVLEEVEGTVAGQRVLAVVFEGTNGARDWQANLSLWVEPLQYHQAQRHVAALLDTAEHKDAQIVLVGHSLGGAIAINVALRQSSPQRPLHVYAFNTSPRGFYAVNSRPHAGATIRLIDEAGEGLKIGRAIWWGKFRDLGPPTTYQFLDFRWRNSLKPAAEHSIYRLSRAMLLLAVGTGDSEAKRMFRANIAPPYAWAPASGRPYPQSERDLDMAFCEDIVARDLPLPRAGP